ncbi:Thioredoxin domain-containing protein [Entamoeba marina]
MILFALFVAVFARSSVWGSVDYKGLNVRDWETGLQEAQRREMPLLVIFLQSNVINDAFHKLMSFTQDKSFMQRTKSFIVVVADDTDDVYNLVFNEDNNSGEYPKVAFFDYNVNKISFSEESADFHYDDSFDVLDAMELVLDVFESAPPQQKEL